MEKRNGLSFNCAESVILQVNDEVPLSGFDDSHMRIASVLGGGIAGCGEVCGAVSGGVVCIGLMFGSEGNESEEQFRLRREHARGLVGELIEAFEQAWGATECETLRAMDEGKSEPRGDLRTESPKNLCDEYVKWSSRRVRDILKNALSDGKIEV
ncbi:C_GCAxxG_C_C family protein [Candidatus Thorarchaeota archaeon]|nr:MAG: C_GCAxxG_C_C family protein [Candidatus Thorarchaeota archaeon]